VLGAGVVHADSLHLIRYQGQAVDSQSVPLEGPYTLTFRLYDAATVGTKEWEEVQPNVPLQGGQFSVLLGQVTPLDGMNWSLPCWLSVQVGSDPELAPRQRITSVPMAIRAVEAERLRYGDASGRVYNTANCSVAHNTELVMTFDAERWNAGAIHSMSANTSRLTAPSAGKYLIFSHVVWAGTGGGSRRIAIRLNGVYDIASESRISAGSDDGRQSIATYYNLAAGDYVELAVFQSSGNALNVLREANDSPEFGFVKMP